VLPILLIFIFLGLITFIARVCALSIIPDISTLHTLLCFLMVMFSMVLGVGLCFALLMYLYLSGFCCCLWLLWFEYALWVREM
jgi:hypothetical protein